MGCELCGNSNRKSAVTRGQQLSDEVKAVPDEAALEDLFGDMKYKIVSDTREYDLPIGDVPICLLDNSLLTKENLESIDKMCHEVVDERIKYSIDNEVFEHDHTGDDEYVFVK